MVNSYLFLLQDLLDECGSGWLVFVPLLEGERFRFSLLVVQLWLKFSTEVGHGPSNNDLTLLLFLFCIEMKYTLCDIRYSSDKPFPRQCWDEDFFV